MKYVYVVLVLLLCCRCSWLQSNDPGPKLPAATQEGRNTFGCYLNGYAWVPEGRPSFFGSKLVLYYNPTSDGGAFDLRATRAVDDHPGVINISVFGLGAPGTYPVGFNPGKDVQVVLQIATNGCLYRSRDSTVTSTGTLTITRLQAGVVAGTFDFTLAKPGCDTIRITDGRFDLPL